VGIGVIIFFWAVRSNQFEDLDRQGYSILFDDDISKESVNIVETKDKADNAEDRK
jgi:cbb3-type cytochrome oxidase maturation protein